MAKKITKNSMKEIIEYLKTLDAETLLFVVNQMGKEHTDSGTNCCGTPMPTDHPTPNGHYVCSGCTWVWVPDIG